MSPSDCAWLHAPGSEQTLRLPVSTDSQTAMTVITYSGDHYLHGDSGGSKAPLKFVGAKLLLLFLIKYARGLKE